MRILELLRTGGQRVSTIARTLGVDKSTASRLLSTMESRGMVRRDADSGKVWLGVGVAVLGQAFHQTFRLGREMGPLLDSIQGLTGENVVFTVFEADEAVYIDKRESEHTLRTHSRIGQRAPLHCGAAGKSILAHLAPAQIDSVLTTGKLQRFTPHTVTDPELLAAELAQIRILGYARSEQEIDLGVRGVGVPILDWADHVLGAISVSGPIIRFNEEQVAKIVELLRRCVGDWQRKRGVV